MRMDITSPIEKPPHPAPTQKNIWKTITLPLIFLGVFLTLFFVWRILDLPPEAELITIARSYFDQYGLIIVLASAIIEGLLLIGWYYPGSLVIMLGVIFAGHNIPRVIGVISIVTLGLYTAYIINYGLGKYGWYRVLLAFGLKEPLDNAQQRLTKYGLNGIAISYVQPNLAAVTATAAGILHFPFRRFLSYSLLAVIGWNIAWGALVYAIGEAALSFVGMKFVFIAIGMWIAVRLIVRAIKMNRAPQNT